jgi:very-short-patch-repair endonuclease
LGKMCRNPSMNDNNSRWHSEGALWEKLKSLAREKRHEPTAAEEKLWHYLRGRKVCNAKFRRQHAIERFIVDFLCWEAHLIIEVDGQIHSYTALEDEIRQEFRESKGFRVIRFTNEQVLHETDKVISQILEGLAKH